MPAALDTRLKVFVLVAVTSLGLVFALACGGDGGSGGDRLSAETYFQKLETIANDTIQAEVAAEPADDPNASPEDIKQDTIDYFNRSASILDAAVKDVEALRPPEDIQEQHDALVAAVRALADSFRGFATGAADVPAEGIEDFADSLVFAGEAYAAFDAACTALQRIAGDGGIRVDLMCQTDEG